MLYTDALILTVFTFILETDTVSSRFYTDYFFNSKRELDPLIPAPSGVMTNLARQGVRVGGDPGNEVGIFRTNKAD